VITRGPIRVVLADDTSDIRLLLRIALEAGGDFKVVGEAADGQEAIEVVEREQPDVVLLDLAMPVMDGLQAIPEIRRVSTQTVILVLSGFGAATMANEALKRGAHDYVQKGLSPSALFERIRALLSADSEPGVHGRS
jgi:DNA-binding NarL/FixJ family response regulator